MNEPVLRFITKDKSGPGYYDGDDPGIVRALAIAAVVLAPTNQQSAEVGEAFEFKWSSGWKAIRDIAEARLKADGK